MATVSYKEGFATTTSYGTSDGLLRKIATDIASANVKNTNLAEEEAWELHFPLLVADITNVMVLKHTLVSGLGGSSREIFLEFYQPVSVESLNVGETARAPVVPAKLNYHYMQVTYGVGNYTSPTGTVDDDGNFPEPGTWVPDQYSPPARWAWYKADTTAQIKKWMPVQYWMSITPDTLSIVIAGDLSATKTDRLVSFAYFGKSKPFNVDTTDRWSSNFGITCGSDVAPASFLTLEERDRYGEHTGNGMTDINMLETYSGFPMQSHKAAFTTPDEFTEKKLEGPSSYTGKYHMTPVYIFHSYDGYRGEVRNVIATDRSSISNRDEMIHKYNAATNCEADPDTEDIFKVFMVDAPYSITNNSSNVLYALAILKQTKTL